MGENRDTKIDIAWEKLESQFSFVEKVIKNGYFLISADQIKKYGEREPRLMTKFDHSVQLPNIFCKNNLSILPTSRGDYRIGQDRMFEKIDCEVDKNLIVKQMPPYVTSITPDKINSETIALNCAYVSGMMSDFLEDDGLVPTVEGRMSSKKFNFKIEKQATPDNNVSIYDSITVENSQIEIDAAYEGIRYLSIFEAKLALCSDFLIRQLYYPYRAWENDVSKKIKLVFFVYSDGLFHFFQYDYRDPLNYNGLICSKKAIYSLEERRKLTLDEIRQVLETCKKVPEPEDVPFPQANDFEKVINVMELANPLATKDDITQMFKITDRQAYYYPDACIYLGLITRNEWNEDIGSTYSITEKGKAILNAPYVSRQLALVKAIVEHPVFSRALRLSLDQGGNLDRNQVIEIITDEKIKIKDSTIGRRADSAISWINWIKDLIEE